MRKIYLLIISMILIIILSMVNYSYATDDYDCSVNIVKSAETIEPGKTIELTISLSNINASNGVTAMMAKLEYNPNIFEKVEDISGTIFDYEEQNVVVGPFRATTNNKELFKVPLTIKSGVSDGEYEFKLTNIQISVDDGTTYGALIKKDEEIASIIVKNASSNTDTSDNNEQGEQNQGGQNQENQNQENQNQENQNQGGQNRENQSEDSKQENNLNDNKKEDTLEKSETNNTKEDNAKNNLTIKEQKAEENKVLSGTSDKEIPYTGVAIGIGSIIIVVAIVALIMYFKYDKYKEIK